MKITNLKKVFIVIPVIVISLYSLIIGFLYYYQESLIFPGSPLSQDYQFNFNNNFQEITLPVDAAQLNALHLKQENPEGLVFFLHGNAGNLKSWTTHVEFYKKINYDMFIFDYRGYGKSTGKIQSQEQLFSDVNEMWKFIAPQYNNKKLIIFGRSLGTSLAVNLAKKANPDLLILVSPFTNMTDIALKRYPLAPSWVLRYPLKTDEMIREVKSKVVFLHGDQDKFIPASHSKKLHLLTQKPSKLFLIEGAAHNDIQNFSNYHQKIISVLPE